MTFASIDEAMRECLKRKYRVNFLMQISRDLWRFSLKIDADHIWRDGASALTAVNNVFMVLDTPMSPRLKQAKDWV